MDQAGGGIGKAAKELMSEMQRAQAEMQQSSQQTQGPNQQFDQAMQAQQQGEVNQTNQVNQTDPTQRVQETQKSSNVLLQAKVNAMTPSTRVGSAAKTENTKMVSMLEGLMSGQDKMSNIMNVALSGKQFSPQELLAMQAGVYRFSQEMELTGKVIEKATSGIKQTMNTQL